MFNFIAALFQIPVEEAVIPMNEALPAIKKLEKDYNDFEMERSQIAAG